MESHRTVIGDAPKDFIRVYEYGTGRRLNQASWPGHIAKVGHKWYPAESITEQLMTRVGEVIGLRMASSKLMACDDQIRFLSRYFLEDAHESLVHGAEILAGYLEDAQFVKDVGHEHLENELFTFQDLQDAISTSFPEQADEIMQDFVRMIGFDAIVGNQDRHLYNWGVIVHTKGLRPPRFAPIFDTARGLFWNTSDSGIGKFDSAASLDKYIDAAHPLIGWENETKINHFRLVGRIAGINRTFAGALRQLSSVDNARVGAKIDREFDRLLSVSRRRLIKRCLTRRLQLCHAAVS